MPRRGAGRGDTRSRERRRLRTELNRHAVTRVRSAAIVPASRGARYGIAESPTGAMLPATVSDSRPIVVLMAEIPPGLRDAIGVPAMGERRKCYSLHTMSCRTKEAGIGLDRRTGDFFRVVFSLRRGRPQSTWRPGVS